jgi:hypothetical protein
VTENIASPTARSTTAAAVTRPRQDRRRTRPSLRPCRRVLLRDGSEVPPLSSNWLTSRIGCPLLSSKELKEGFDAKLTSLEVRDLACSYRRLLVVERGRDRSGRRSGRGVAKV